jgi:pimeloyl-ACP methyl ester carboxylesterase
MWQRRGMGRAATDHGIELQYETYGDPSDPPLLLINGLGAQLISWPDRFARLLAGGSRHVIVFDNRDCGLSSRLDGEAVDLPAVISALRNGDPASARSLAPYSLSDMAGDAAGLLSVLGIERAHVLGASLGGAVAQTVAIEHPDRCLSLTSMMSNTGEPEYGQSTPEAMRALMKPSQSDREGYIEGAAASLVWRSKKYPGLDAALGLAAESYDRCYYPEGITRQMAAMITSGSRADGLRQLRLPTLVIHGTDDTLITPTGGERTAALVPGARYLLVQDMGHDRPEPLWPTLSAAILEHTGAITG